MKRVFSLFLCLVMLLSLFPASALATEDGNGGDNRQEPTQQTDSADDSSGDGQDDPDQNEGDGKTDGNAQNEGDGQNAGENPPAGNPDDPEQNPDDPEEPGKPEEPEPDPEEESKDAPKEDEKPVRVVFVCDPKETVITVYDTVIDKDGKPSPATDEDGNYLPILPEEDGAYLLMPGIWFYDAECAGYECLDKAELTVKAPAEGESEQTVTLELKAGTRGAAKGATRGTNNSGFVSFESATPSQIIAKIEEIKGEIDGLFWNMNYSESALIEHINNGDYKYGTQVNHPCGGTHSGANATHLKGDGYPCTSNSFGGAIQCVGFANYMAYAVFGVKQGNSTWIRHSASDGNMENITLEPGDYVIDNVHGHTFLVWYVDGETIYVANGNDATGCSSGQQGNCRIRFGNYAVSLSTTLERANTLNSKNESCAYIYKPACNEGRIEPVVAESVTTSDGFHKYERYDNVSYTWEQAKSFCESLGGHLATITSEEEQLFIQNNVLSGCTKNVYFIGGTDITEDKTLSWITGESFSYSNWDQTEPSLANGENYAAIMGKDVGSNKQAGEWIDIFNLGDKRYNGYYLSKCGFICEYDKTVSIPLVHPCILNETVTDITANSAVLSAKIYFPENKPTICWGLELGPLGTSYLTSVSFVDSFDNTQPANYQAIGGTNYFYPIRVDLATDAVNAFGSNIGLLPNTQYCFRFWVKYNSDDGERIIYSEPMTFKTLSKCGTNLTWTIDGDGTLLINGTGAMDDYWESEGNPPWYNSKDSISSVVISSGVTSIGVNAFRDCLSLSSVSIPSSVTSIGYGAFYGCDNLSSISIPSGVTSIGEEAFSFCGSLTSITLPSSVKNIGYNAFRCSAIGTIEIPSGVTTISGGAFEDCYNLTSVSIPNTVTSIGYGAFSGCGQLKSITIPSSVKTIEDHAFDNCQGFTSITIPNGVTSIGEEAFYGCSKLSTITIPSSVTRIGDRAFVECGSLTAINVTTGNTAYCDVGGVLFSADMKNLIQYPVRKTGSSYAIPNGVVTIGEYAFSYPSDYPGLTSITIPNSVTSIGDYAFCYCNKLSSIEIPNSVTGIGNYAFSECFALTSVTIPGSVNSIGEWAFFACRALETVTIQYGVTSIREWAFGYCSNLTSITIPNSVTSIGEDAFNDCAALSDVYYSGTLAQWNSISKGSGNSKLSDAVKHYGYSSEPASTYTIAYNANGGTGAPGSQLKTEDETLTLSTVTPTRDGESAGSFTVELNPNGGSVGTASLSAARTTSYSFKNWNTAANGGGTSYAPGGSYTANAAATLYAQWNSSTSTAAVTLPTPTRDGYTFKGWAASAGASSGVTGSYTPTGNVTLYATWGEDLLASGDWGTNLHWTLTNSGLLTISGSGAMNDMDDMEPGAWGLYSESIQSVIINDGVTSIGASAFWGCSSLRTVSMPDSVRSIGLSAFNGCGLTSVTIPDRVTSISGYTFTGCSSLSSVTIPEGVLSIGENAFERCTSLSSISIPASVTNINSWAFNDCSLLSEIIVCNGNAHYCDVNGILFSADKTALLCYPQGKTATAFQVPDTVTSIGDGAFSGCNVLTSVTLPNNLVTIGDYAFASCEGITSLKIPSNVTSIGDYAFLYCSALTEVTVSENITGIGEGAFHFCTSLTDVYFGGTETQWNNISKGECNAALTTATKHFKVTLSASTDDGNGNSVSGPNGVGITVSPSGTLYEDVPVTVTAPAVPGYHFDGWYCNEELVCGALVYSFNITKNTFLKARYTAIGNATVTVSTINNAGYTVTGSDAIQNGSTHTVPLGTVLTLTAYDADRFLQWQNGSSKVMGRSPTLSITVVGDMSITLVYKAVASENQSYVQFVSDYGQVVQAQAYTKNSDIGFPAPPTKFGYTFDKWVFDGTEETADAAAIKAKIGTESTITVKPSYTKDQTAFTVTVQYQGVDRTNDVYADILIGSGYTVTAPQIDGKQFQCWKRGDTTVGYENSFFLQVSGNITLTAVYGDAAVEVLPVITMSELSVVSGDVHKVTGTATRSIPDGYTLVEHGILYARGYDNPTTESFVYNGSGVNKYISSSTTKEGVVKLNVKVETDTVVVTLRGYMILINDSTGNEVICYTDLVSGSYSGITGNA